MVNDPMPPAPVSLRTRALEPEGPSSRLALEARQRRPKKGSPKSFNCSELESELKSGYATLGSSVLI